MNQSIAVVGSDVLMLTGIFCPPVIYWTAKGTYLHYKNVNEYISFTKINKLLSNYIFQDGFNFGFGYFFYHIAKTWLLNDLPPVERLKRQSFKKITKYQIQWKIALKDATFTSTATSDHHWDVALRCQSTWNKQLF